MEVPAKVVSSMASSERYMSLAEHLAYRPEQEAQRIPKKAPYRLGGTELRMSRRPTTVTAKVEARMQPSVQPSQATGISPKATEEDEGKVIERTRPTQEPELGFNLRFDELDNQGSEAIEPSSRPSQQAVHKPSTSPKFKAHTRIKTHGSLRRKSRQVFPAQPHHPESPSVLNFNPRSRKEPVAAGSPTVNAHRPDSAMDRPRPEKRRNPVSVPDLRLKACPSDILVTSLELSQELQPVKQQALSRPHKHQNPVSISDLRLNHRPSGQPVLFRSQPEVSDVAPASAAGISSRKPQNRLFAANLTLNPRPSQYQAVVSSSEGGDELVEGTALVAPSQSTAPSASTPESPAPTSPQSIGSLPLRTVPALTSALQGIAFHPAGFFSSSDPASSPASIFTLSSNKSDLLDLGLPPPATTSTIDMVPPKKWSRGNNASYAKAASAKEDTSTKATASKATFSKAVLTNPTSAMVCPFNVGTNNTATPAIKSQSTPVPVIEKAVSSAQGNPCVAASPVPEMTTDASSAAAPASNDEPVVPATDTVAVAAPGPTRAVMKTYVLLAAFGYKQADSHDPELKAILGAIEKRFSVTIDIDGAKNRLIIYSPNKQKAAETIQSLRRDLWLEPGSSNVWSPSLFLGPPKTRLADFKATLDIEESPSGGRPAAQGNAPAALPHEAIQLRAKWTDDFRNTMFKAAKTMRVRPVQMGMRIHLGKVRLQERQKNKTSYSFNELQAWASRHCSRHGFKFDKLLGADGFAYRILEKICTSDGFGALDNRAPRARDVRPKHTLILHTINLRIETDIISVYDGSREVLRLGPARGYRREQRKEVMEIGTIFPEKNFDWNLSVETRVPVASLPFTHEDISSNAIIAANEDPEGFPRIFLHDHFAQSQKVEDIKGKTSWSFKLKATDFVVEVAIHHLLRANTSKSVQSGTGIDMHYSAWDDELDAHNPANGPRKWTEENFKELFPSSGDKDGISAFLGHVTEVQDFISKMAAEDSPGKPVSEGPVVGEEDLMTFEEELKKMAEEYTIKKETGIAAITDGVNFLDVDIKQEEDDQVVKSKPAYNIEDLRMFEEKLGKGDAIKREIEENVGVKEESDEELLISFD